LSRKLLKRPDDFRFKNRFATRGGYKMVAILGAGSEADRANRNSGMELPTHEDLVRRLTITEDQFTERKSKSDKNGWLKTVVAFANSNPVGYPAVLFIGVNDHGVIADRLKTEDLMKSFSSLAGEHIFPAVYYWPVTVEHAGRSCVAIIIPGSEHRPHFVGKSYVRDGTQSIEATDDQFNKLIAQRNSKAAKLLEWRGRKVIFEHFLSTGSIDRAATRSRPWLIPTSFISLTASRKSGTLFPRVTAFLWIGAC
jgi:Putative DNA-binding domain